MTDHFWISYGHASMGVLIGKIIGLLILEPAYSYLRWKWHMHRLRRGK